MTFKFIIVLLYALISIDSVLVRVQLNAGVLLYGFALILF